MVLNAHYFTFWSYHQQEETTKAGQLVPPAGNHKGWVNRGDNHFAPGWVTWQGVCPSLHLEGPLHAHNIKEKLEFLLD